MMDPNQPPRGGKPADPDPKKPDDQAAEQDRKSPVFDASQGWEAYPRDEKDEKPDPYAFRSLLQTPQITSKNPKADPVFCAPVIIQTPASTLDQGTPGPEEPRISLRNVRPITGIAAVMVIVGALVFWILSKPVPPLNDLGAGVFNAAGIQAHLIARWEGKAQYRLRVEPLGIRQHAGFAAVAADPPRPMAIDLRLMDASGFVLCNKTVLFPFDPSKAVEMNGSGATAGKGSAESPLDPEQQKAQEAQREQGKDLFQNEIDADGKVAAVTAQGDLPCDVQSYKRLDYFDFTTEFPTLAEQAELLRLQEERLRPRPAPSSGAKGLATLQSLPAPIEGNDSITGHNPSTGAAETASGKVFIIDKIALQTHATGWQVFPAPVHYRCDKTAACILTVPGTSVVMHARLRR
jgi:hypothetical protein